MPELPGFDVLLPGSGSVPVRLPFCELTWGGRGDNSEHRDSRFKVLRGLLWGFRVYLGLFDSARQKEKSFPEVISLEISPTGLHVQVFLS